MSTSSHDTQPEGRHVTTDPGLGVTVRERTDPGVAPPVSASQTLEVMGDESKTPATSGVDRDAETPVPAITAASPAREVPRAVARIGGDPTPVPPELTDGLLSGLLASENEAYFRKAKASSESSGEAAVAFHGAPHAVAAGNPTPAPEPPVLLRRSVEMELAESEALAKAGGPPAHVRKDRDTDPPSPVRRFPELLPEPTVPLPEPRAVWTDKAIAFGLAALAVGALGIILVRWVGGSSDPAASASPSKATQVATSTVAPPGPQVAAPAVQIPPPPSVEPTTPAADTAVAAEPVPSDTPPVKPGGKATRNPGTRRAPGQSGASGPVEVVPPPKDDVKRSM